MLLLHYQESGTFTRMNTQLENLLSQPSPVTFITVSVERIALFLVGRSRVEKCRGSMEFKGPVVVNRSDVNGL